MLFVRKRMIPDTRRFKGRQSMKAVVLEKRGADGAEWRDFPDPIPAPGESVMRVVASSLNRVDLYMRDSGVGITHKLPQVMGVEGAGEIVEARARQRAAAGDESDPLFRGVLRQMPLLSRRRSAALRVRADPGRTPSRRFRGICGDAVALLFRLPDDADLTHAGLLMTAYLTAWRMLFGKKICGPARACWWSESAAALRSPACNSRA